jgi:hypothetical protein
MKSFGFKLSIILLSVAVAASCGKKDDHSHTPGESHDHAHENDREKSDKGKSGDAGHHDGPVIDLGSALVAGVKVRATRDAGKVVPGGDVPLDFYVDGDRKGVTSVRFWIGLESGAGSVKALAPVEGDHWHTHVEVPKPMPEGAKAWVEVEGTPAGKVAFDLRP